MSNEDYSPRQDDHLVEPMFAGLGVGEDETECEPETEPEVADSPDSATNGVWGRILAWFRR